jgi:copper(I)-binding protein
VGSAAAAVVALVTCAGESGALRVLDAYAAEPVTPDAAAVYFRVVNPGAAPDTLLAAECGIAARAAVHAQRAAGGMVHMHPAGPVTVPAEGALQLQPGGLHLMLEGLTVMPRAGDTIHVTLRFARAGAIPVRVPVIPYAEVTDRGGRS